MTTECAMRLISRAAMVFTAILGIAHPLRGLPRSSTPLQAATPSEKQSRTAAQQKIDSQLLYEIYRARGEAAQKNVPPGKTTVKVDRKGRALVDVRADVTPALRKAIGTIEGTIVSTSGKYHSIVAWIPLLKLEHLAEDPSVRAIVPAAEATTVRPVPDVL